MQYCQLVLVVSCGEGFLDLQRIAKRPTLQAAGQLNAFQAPVEHVAKSQSLQIAGHIAKRQTLQTAGQSDALQALGDSRKLLCCALICWLLGDPPFPWHHGVRAWCYSNQALSPVLSALHTCIYLHTYMHIHVSLPPPVRPCRPAAITCSCSYNVYLDS